MKFFDRSYNLEQCIKKAHELGFKGIEIVAAQMIENYPYPTQEWCQWFCEILKKYDMQPLSYSAYIDMGQNTGRDLTEEEIMQCTMNDIIYANRMGFSIVRTQHAISPKILRKLIPFAEKWNVSVGVELHAPHSWKTEVWQEYAQLFKEEGSDYIGVVPDMGIFQEHPHRPFQTVMVESGIIRQNVEKIISDFEKGMTKKDLLVKYHIEDIKQAGVINTMYETFRKANLEDLKNMIPYSKYIHGKFYYIDEQGQDSCIPYDRIVNIIKNEGFKGHIAAEYEGHFSDGTIDCTEQLGRFSNMMQRLL